MTHLERDYSCASFTRTFERDNSVFFASFIPEAEEGEFELHFTGRYIVLMLHPTKGTIQFHMEKKADRWRVSSTDRWTLHVEQDLIDWCNNAIQHQQL